MQLTQKPHVKDQDAHEMSFHSNHFQYSLLLLLLLLLLSVLLLLFLD